MKKLLIMTDSNSGITQEMGKQLGITVIPMPFTINGEEYLEDISISQKGFYEFLEKGADVTTSQPSRFYLEELWNEKLKEYEEILYIPMSSGLSASCFNAISLAESFNEKVKVVDNARISVTLKSSVLEGLEMAKQGKSAGEIKEYLENEKHKNSIYILVSTMKYLKKGGRVSPALALLSDALNVKPVLFSNGDKFERFALALNVAQAKKRMIIQIKKELENNFKQDYENGKMEISVAHTQNEIEAHKFAEEIKKEIPNVKLNFIDPLSLSVSCHIGSGSLAVALYKNSLK